MIIYNFFQKDFRGKKENYLYCFRCLFDILNNIYNFKFLKDYLILLNNTNYKIYK